MYVYWKVNHAISPPGPITRNADDIIIYKAQLSVSHLAMVKLAKNLGRVTLTYKHSQKIFPKINIVDRASDVY